MAPLPKRITRQQVLQALDVLGIPHTDVRSVSVGLYEVVVRELLKPETKAETGKGVVHVERVTTIPTSVLRGSKPADEKATGSCDHGVPMSDECDSCWAAAPAAQPNLRTP